MFELNNWNWGKFSDIETNIQKQVNIMLKTYSDKLEKNVLRQDYYNEKTPFKDLMISTPEKLRHKLKGSLGWAKTAVDKLSERIVFDKFVTKDGVNSFGIDKILDDNNFELVMQELVTSTLIHSCAFMVVNNGDVQSGEPDILLLAKSAAQATGIMNQRTRKLDAGMSILHVDDDGAPDKFALYLPNETIVFEHYSNFRSKYTRIANPTRRPLIEPLIFKSELTRPFGHSRISDTVMDLTDKAIRTMIRGEVSAEFYSAPKRYILGLENNANGEEMAAKLRSTLDTVWAIGQMEDGSKPQVGEFTQSSFEPHNAQLRMWASMLSAHTSVPVEELGFPYANQSSADGVSANREPLKLIAQSAMKSFSVSLKRFITTAVMLRDQVATIPPELETLQAVWKPAFTPSSSQLADILTKIKSVTPWIEQTMWPFEMLGLEKGEIANLEAQRDRILSDENIKRISERLEGEITPSTKEETTQPITNA